MKLPNYKRIGEGRETMSSSTGTQRKDAEGADGVDRLFQEINLLNLERFLFSTDRKRPVSAGTLLDFTDSKEKFYKIKVGDFGQPEELAYRVLHAVMFTIVQKGRTCDSGICEFPAC